LNIENLLNKEQLEAVYHKDGPILILAGAGSGKTRVITYRIAHLLSEHRIPPGNILAVTFTNKAAMEMKSRIKKAAGKQAEEIQISTFHAFGCKILRRHADKLGYTRQFSIYDEDDRERLVKECMHQAKVSDKEMKPYEIIKRISSIKNMLISPSEYSEKYASEYTSKITARIYEIYEEKIRRCNAMDFDDLISRPVELFVKKPEILALYRDKFRYILIDEYQDINNSQYVLITMLAEKYKNICVVGDDDQSIYRFRGADITNILGFEQDYPEAKVIRLEQNYRSTKNILSAAHSVIKNNAGRKDKELWTDNTEGEKITFYYADDEVHESECILDAVDRLMRFEGVRLKDIAVFYRTNAQSRVIEDRFRRAGLPYKLIGGIQFYGRMEIKDLLAYLRTVANPSDIMSFKRIINVPPRGIGDATIDRVEEYTFEKSLTFFEGLGEADKIEGIKDSTRSSLLKLYGLIKHLVDSRGEMRIQDILKTIISGTGYLDYWSQDASPKAKDRVDNIRELVSAISEFEDSSKEAKLEDFLNQVALVSDADKLDENADAVTLMTIHSAKGLEFDTAFIAGMNEGVFPHRNCIEEPDGIEEERRLAYVGITRARKKLFLLSAVSRRQFGAKKEGKISRFVDEIPAELLMHKGRLPVKTTEEKYMKTGAETLMVDAEPDYGLPDEEIPPLKPGDRVKHKVMGPGYVARIEPHGSDFKVTVVFQKCGKKVLSAAYAGLKKTG